MPAQGNAPGIRPRTFPHWNETPQNVAFTHPRPDDAGPERCGPDGQVDQPTHSVEATEPPPHPRQPNRPIPRRCSGCGVYVGNRQERGVTVRMLPTQLPTKVLRCERFRAYSGGGRWTPKTAETRIVACDAGIVWRRAESGGVPRKGGKMVSEYTRQELNLRPTDSKSGALSN